MQKTHINYLFLFAIIVFALPVHSIGIGAGPIDVHYDGVLRGGYAEQTILISNPSESILRVDLDFNGIIKNWLASPYGSSFTIEPLSRTDLKLVLKPPVDAAVGNYTGLLKITGSLDKSNLSGTGTDIAPGVNINIYVALTGEQKLGFSVNDISVEDAEEQMPVKVTLEGENTGNVRVSPDVRMTVYGNDMKKLVLSTENNLGEFLPTVSDSRSFNLSNLSIGQYWANISVFVGSRFIESEFLTFEVFQKDSLRKKGELVQLTNNVWSAKDEIVRIDALFKNTGEVAVIAKFKGEILDKDQNIIGILESDELNVDKGTAMNLTVYFTPKEEGKYLIRGHVLYSQKLTYQKESILNVISLPEGGFLGDWRQTIIIIIVVVIFIILIRKYAGR